MMSRISLICLLALTLAACGFTGDDKEPGADEPSKKDIAQITEPGQDYCDLYDWYGDGVCDEFCTQPDPDCGATCLAYPSCGPDQIQVDSCDGLSECEPVSICGSTIYCQDDNVSCLAIAPACGPDQTPVDQCDTDDPRCTLYSDGCGADLYCWEAPVTCDAEPVCPESTHQVTSCDAQTQCHEVTFCGTTILCQQDLGHCEAYPSCPSGYVEVEQCPADAGCVDQFMCGYKITCMEDGPVDCRALPVCDEGDTEVDSCPPNTSCYERTMCGQTITCAEYGASCLAIPTCDQNEYQVSNQECASSLMSCERVSMCGQTIFCKDLPQACPEAIGVPPSCPNGATETNYCSQRELDAGTCYPVFGSDDQCSNLIYCRV